MTACGVLVAVVWGERIAEVELAASIPCALAQVGLAAPTQCALVVRVLLLSSWHIGTLQAFPGPKICGIYLARIFGAGSCTACQVTTGPRSIYTCTFVAGHPEWRTMS